MDEKWTWPTVKRVKEAAEELKTMIRAKYPDAKFNLTRAPDDQHIWFLWTLVDIDDPEEIRGLTEDRQEEMLVDERILLHVRPTNDRRDIFGYQARPLKKTG